MSREPTRRGRDGRTPRIPDRAERIEQLANSPIISKPVAPALAPGTYLYTVEDLKVAFNTAHAMLEGQDSERTGQVMTAAWAQQSNLGKIRDQLVLRRFARPGENPLAMQRRLLAG
jgi:hypothetical protein